MHTFLFLTKELFEKITFWQDGFDLTQIDLNFKNGIFLQFKFKKY